MKFRFKSEESFNQFMNTLEKEKIMMGCCQNTQKVIDLFEVIQMDEFEGELLGSDMIGVNEEFPFDDNDSFVMFSDEIEDYLEIVQ